LGRFLEHSRIFWFENGGEPEAWIGSADLMHRNLDRRVEALVRLPRRAHVEQLGALLDKSFDDETSAWHLQADGTWKRRNLAEDGTPLNDLQDWLIGQSQRRRRS
jgi:polyphosphate kinase